MIFRFPMGLWALLMITVSTSVLGAPVGESVAEAVPELDCVIEPSDIVDLGSAVSGVVSAILVDRSDRVTQGTVVATLESSVEQAALALAAVRAELNSAIELRREGANFGYRTLKRNQNLLKKSVIAVQDIDQIKSEARIAQLQVEQEKENKRIAVLERHRAQAILDQRTLRSPVDGVVMDRFKSVGEFVEDEPLLRLAQLDPLNVEVVVPVEYLGRVEAGMQADVTALVPGSEPLRATVRRVDVVADAASGTYGVRLTLPNPDYRIPAGLRCRLAFLPPGPEVPAERRSPETDDFATGPVIEAALMDQHPDGDEAPKGGYEGEVLAPVSVVSEVSSDEPVPQSTGSITVTATDAGPALAAFPQQPEDEVAEASISMPLVASVAPPETCFRVGPIDSRGVAHRLSEGLKSWVGKLALREEDFKRASEFIVITAPQQDRDAAKHLVGRLKVAGINDLYLFNRGPNRNQISLGLYGTREYAEKRQRQLAVKGFDTQIVPRYQDARRYWLDFSLRPGSALPGQIDRIGSALVPAFASQPVACGAHLAQR